MGTASVQTKKASVTLAGKSSKSKKSALTRDSIPTESEDFSGDDSFPVSGEGIDLDWGSIPVDPPESEPRVQAAPEETEEKEIQEKEDKEEVQLKEEAIASAEDEEKDVQAKEEDEKDIQAKEDKEEVQLKTDDEETVQTKEEEEEKIQAKEEDEEVQLKTEEEEKVQAKDDDEEVQLKELKEEESVQTKLSIGKPGDQYEQEADRVARKVIEMPDPASQESVQRQPEAPKKEEKPEIQAKGQSANANANFEQNLSQGQGGGSPLGNETKDFMESRFDTDFSGVRVHTDSNAVQMNKQIGAQAFTHGKDVYFNAGKYNPGSSSGKELLAHELTHTIQQTGGTPRAKSLDASEKKENKIQAKTLSSLSGGLSSVVQRREDPSAAQPVETAPAPEQNAPALTEEGSGGGGETAQNAPEAPQQEAAAPAPPAPQEEAAPQENAPQGAAPAPSEGGTSAPTSPEADPDFQAVVTKTQGVAEEKKQHAPAKSEAKAAQAAAESPANEVESQAQDVKVGEMEQEPTGSFSGEQFKQDLLAKIEAVLPQDEESAENFKNNNQLDSVKNDVASGVKQEQEQAGASLEQKTQEAPDTGSIEPRVATPLESSQASPAPGDLGGEKAVPKPKSESEVSAPLQENSQALDTQMAEAGVTEKQLENSNEPQFMGALAAKRETQTHSSSAPATYRQQEQGVITQAQGQAKATVDTQTQAMHGEQEQALSQVMGLQGTTKGKDEGKRSEIAGQINQIYEDTKGKVDTALNGLEEEVSSKFDTAAGTAKQKFENYVDAKMTAYKEERYGSWYNVGGWLKRAKDTVMGLPPEVNQFFVDGRQLYLDEMDIALTDISNLVAERLNEAKTAISEGKQKIQDYVASLPEEQRQMGEEAAQNIQGKFDQLEANVNSKREELLNSLTQQYSTSLQAVDQRIEEMKAANKGLYDRAKDMISGVFETIKQIRDMISGALSSAAAAIGAILSDPIGFLSNLIDGIRQGFNNFSANIVQHLQNGLVSWLTGTMGSTGIQIPDDLFSLKGIFSLVTQVLGLTWDYVRGKAVKMFGEPVVNAMETGVEIFQVLRSEGLSGAWQYVQEEFTDLKESVMGSIREMVITEVIKAGITWIFSLLNPASAFIKAAKAIYDIVMFFINRGSQIAALIQAISQSISAIASGALGQAAQFIEDALAKSIPVVIGLLASLLGLGGLATKVQKIIGKIRKRIDKAINKLLKKAKKAAGKLLKKLGLRDEQDNNAENADPEHDAKVNKGLKQIDTEEQKYMKDGNKITKEDAEKVAKTVKKNNPVFKSITVIDGGKSWDYDYVASKGKKKGEQKSKSNIVDTDLLKKIHKNRPGWWKDTDVKLKKKYPECYEGDKPKPGYDRRHIVSFETIYKDLKNKLQGKTFEKAATSLTKLGHKPQEAQEEAILKAAKKCLAKQFNDVDNLWVGESEENRRKGRAIRSLLSRLKKRQNESRAVQKQLFAEKDSKQKDILRSQKKDLTDQITEIISQLKDARLDLPQQNVVSGAKKMVQQYKYQDMLHSQMRRDSK